MYKKIIIFFVGVLVVGSLFVLFRGSQDSGMEGAEDSVMGEVKETKMSFFVTSENPGNGANFGGLSGADMYCQTLATEAGFGDKQWAAYLSSSAEEGEKPVNARDRIGSGPWYNFNGELIASNIDELHTNNNINKQTALSEKGEVVNGRGDNPNVHDILTGSTPDGLFSGTEDDTTCANWTSETDGSAIVGHHDRIGLDESDEAKSWNSSHGSRGCSLTDLNGTGGGGLLYCFAKGE